MSNVSKEHFLQLQDCVTNFKNNITKDNQERRNNLEVINKQLVELGKLESKFSELRDQYNKTSSSSEEIREVKAIVQEINDNIIKSRQKLLDRLDRVVQATDSSNIDTIGKKDPNMTDKFELRTAASLLPSMDGTEDVTKNLIDAIELYSQLLDENGNKMLINYVLKIKLTQSAKLRLEKTYSSVKDLVKGMNDHLLTKKSVSALASELHSIRQDGKSVEEFGKSIEKLLVDLTITQADGNDSSLGILRQVNEKIAINSFSNGLQNRDIRTIIKARNYTALKDAIVGAKDEEKIQPSSTNAQKMFFIPKNNLQRGHYRGAARGRFNQTRPNY